MKKRMILTELEFGNVLNNTISLIKNKVLSSAEIDSIFANKGIKDFGYIRRNIDNPHFFHKCKQGSAIKYIFKNPILRDFIKSTVYPIYIKGRDISCQNGKKRSAKWFQKKQKSKKPTEPVLTEEQMLEQIPIDVAIKRLKMCKERKFQICEIVQVVSTQIVEL